ncbi:hypothetical protein ACHAW5_005652 [Stephanodiscus triporus]|uniref:ALMS motif domain-containing protein n=1 Tax=Stephanodiscus triporus TaxID=2934178 RepID=A0ABD3P5B5_9STRA
MSFLESFEESDVSLLVSPAVNRSRARDNQQHVTASEENNVLEPRHSNGDKDGALEENSFILAQTPAKAKFNYASAMEELEWLAPTPATATAAAKKERRQRQPFVADEVEEGDDSSVVEHDYAKQQPTSLGVATVASLGCRLLFSLPGASASPTVETTDPTGGDDSPSSPSLQATGKFSPVNLTDDAGGDEAINATDNRRVDDTLSVFRHPCIRKSISGETSSLELQLGHPVNQSYDSTAAFVSNGFQVGDERIVKDSVLSMEVENASANVDYGEFLVGSLSGDLLLNRPDRIGVNGENQTDGLSEEDADANTSIDLAVNQGKVIHSRPKFRPPINEENTVPWNSVCNDDSEDTTESNDKSSGYVEVMRQSIDSYFSSHLGSLSEGNDGSNNESSKNLDNSSNEKHVESPPLRTSISSENSSLDLKLGHPINESYDSTNNSWRVNENQGTSYSKGSDDDENEEGVINLSAMGDDASQIDIDDTLAYAGYIHSSHHQRYDVIFGGGDNAPNDEEGDRTRTETSDQLQDCLIDNNAVDENKPDADYTGESNFQSDIVQLELENCNDSKSISESSHSSESNGAQVPMDIKDQLIDTSYGSITSHSGPEDRTGPSAYNDAQEGAKDFCGFPKGSAVGIDPDFAAEHAYTSMDASNSDESQLDVIQKAKSSLRHIDDDVRQEKSLLEMNQKINGFSHDILFLDSIDSQRVDNELLASSPISEERGNIDFEHSYISNQMLPESAPLHAPVLGSLSDDCLSPISKSSSPHNCSEENFVRHDNRLPTILDESLTSDGSPWQKYKRNESTEKNVSYPTGTSNDMKSILLVDKVKEKSSEPNASAEDNNEAHPSVSTKASIFQVLSHQPVLEDSLKESAPEDAKVIDLLDRYVDDSAESEELDRPIEIANQEHVQNLHNGEALSILEKQSQSKRKSLEDLSSYQQSFNSTSSAFIERLRGAAEYRKREVTRGRYSMERKEQILFEEKKVRTERLVPAVDEENMEKATRKSAAPRKSTFEGKDPYIPFKARPLPASTTERMISRTETPSSRFSTSSLGAKRKTSNAFRPHPAQNESHVKIPALNVKPPKRLLSGEDASMAKEMSHKKRLQEEEERIKRESTFIARPLPVTTQTRKQIKLAGENLVSAKSAQRGKENDAFVPRSSIRAEKRKSYDVEKRVREQQRREADIERRQQRIEQIKTEINDLTKTIR